MTRLFRSLVPPAQAALVLLAALGLAGFGLSGVRR